MKFKLLRYDCLDNLLRFDEWQEHSFSTSIFLIFLLYPFTNYNFKWSLVLIWIIIELIWLYSFMINDWYDKDVDKAAEKKKIIHNWTKKKAFSIYSIIILVGLLSGFLLGLKVFILTFLAFFFAHIYSAPPRFKTKGIWAPIILSIGYLIPLIIISLTLNTFNIFLLPFAGVLFFSEITDNLRHHIKDYKTDKETIKTFVIEKGIKKSEHLLKQVDYFAIILIISVYILFSYSLNVNGMKVFSLATIFMFGLWFVFVLFFIPRDIHKDISRTLMNHRFTLLFALLITIYSNQIEIYVLWCMSILSSKLFLKRILRKDDAEA